MIHLIYLTLTPEPFKSNSFTLSTSMLIIYGSFRVSSHAFSTAAGRQSNDTHTHTHTHPNELLTYADGNCRTFSQSARSRVIAARIKRLTIGATELSERGRCRGVVKQPVHHRGCCFACIFYCSLFTRGISLLS